PVFALTAISSPHGGAWQEYIVLGSQKRRPSGVILRQVGAAAGVPSSFAPPPRRPCPPDPCSRCPHCPAFITFVIIRPSPLWKVTPFQLPPPIAPGNNTMSCFSCHG